MKAKSGSPQGIVLFIVYDYTDMKFPQDLLRFLYWIFFKPFSLYKWVNRSDPTLANTAALLARSGNRFVRSFRELALFYTLIMPWLLGFGIATVLSQLGMDVNWLRLVFCLSVAIALSLAFSINFCVAFLLPFSVAVAFWSSTSFPPTIGILFGLMLGLAYGLTSNSARWGLTAGLVYGVILDHLSGLVIGAVFLIGYFRIVFYLMEAPLSWGLGILAAKGDAVRLWQFHPVVWDELIWFPLPGLDRHLLAIERQDGPAFQSATLHIQESFRQHWAVQRIKKLQAVS